MKNNTTSNDTCYTIQPLTTCIDIKTERKLIASWHTSGLSDDANPQNADALLRRTSMDESAETL